MRDVISAERMNVHDSTATELRNEREALAIELTTKTKAKEAAQLFVPKAKAFFDTASKSKQKNRIKGEATYTFKK